MSLLRTRVAFSPAQTWAQQLDDFLQEVVGDGVLMVGNSIGSLATLMVRVHARLPKR